MYAFDYASRGRAWKGLGEYAKAIADLDSAIQIDSTLAPAFFRRAWIRATCPDGAFRDGKKAVDDATKCCELSNWDECLYLDVLAAAYAESAEFDEAVEWEKKAIRVARISHRPSFEQRLKSYQKKMPFRDALSK
jgi:tetratricopeptide (TPR) repeat protein